MHVKTTDAIKLYGTEEAVGPMQKLTAGPLTCEFDHGALRYINIYGKEAIRNIAFVARDKDWGTYLPTISGLRIDQREDSFSVEFDAVCKDEMQEIHYRACITGTPDGNLFFTGNYTAVTDFVTNRTGFVVLHPVAGVAGRPAILESVTGDIEEAVFPELIDPIQPFKNIRAITHEVLPGISVCCRLTGDTFEMEDQRQWNDASYKTYSRPLELPWPYTLSKGESLHQSASVTLLENVAQNITKTNNQTSNQTKEHCIITVSALRTTQTLPRIGLGLEPQHLAGAMANQKELKKLAPQQLVVWHELTKHSVEHLKQAAQLARSIDTEIELQAVIPDRDFKSEIAELASRCRDIAVSIRAINVAPEIYLHSIMPGPSWPKVTELAEIYDEVREYFPKVKIGGGMLSFFPELNRHRPPIKHLDFISHASNTITHACDDISVTENLEALPYIIKTCRDFAGNKPYHVGPSSIGMRFNPYGSKTIDNPNNSRIAMARIDPRQRGLINAAWTLAYVAHMARGGIACVNLHAPTGEFGIFNFPEAWPRPGFDNTRNKVYPVYHIVAGFAQAAGKPQQLTHSSMSREVEAVAFSDDTEQVLWISNLTSILQTVEVKGFKIDDGRIATLSLDTFDLCTQDSGGFERSSAKTNSTTFELGPYCVVRLTQQIS